MKLKYSEEDILEDMTILRRKKHKSFVRGNEIIILSRCDLQIKYWDV